MPLVQSFAGHLLLRDCLFSSDEAICDHFRTVNRRLLGGPLYRVMFVVASPQMTVFGSERRFSTMFDGITLSTRKIDDNRAHLQLRYPPGILPPLVGRLYLTAFEVAVELAGGKDVRGKSLDNGSTLANYDLSWK
jgi:hypothetical protein